MKTLALSRLQNAEHLAFLHDVMNLLAEASIPELEALRTKMLPEVAREDAAQKEILKSEHTAKIETLDYERDELFRGFILRLESEQHAKDEARKTAANRLRIVTDTYGNLTKLNLQKETEVMENLLQDLRSSKYLPSITAIACEDWLQWIKEANDSVRDLYTKRRDDFAARPDYDMKDIRKTVDAHFDQLSQRIAALDNLTPTPKLTTLIDKLNVSIQRWNDTLAQRRGKRKSEKAD